VPRERQEIIMTAPSFVQAKAAAEGSFAYSSNVTKGDFLIAVVQMTSTSQPSGVTDTVGSSWTELVSGQMNVDGSTFYAVSVWTATAKASGANTVTANSGSGVNAMEIAEYSAANVDVFSTFATGNGSSSPSSITGNSATTTYANETLVGWGSSSQAGLGAALGGYTRDVTTGGAEGYNNTERQSVSAIGTYTADFAFSEIAWACGVIALYTPSDYPPAGNFVLEGNSGVQGATITLSGAASATVVSDLMGNWQFTGLAAGAYTVTPSKTGYTFSPTSSNQTIGTTNILGVNFMATLTSDSSAFSTVDSRTSPNSQLLVGGTQLNVVPAPRHIFHR
jgi:hypothetical protein